jgi:TonB-dependent SusC/RagA subfamily outer membrane receptor
MPQEQRSTLTAAEIANRPNEPIEKTLQNKVSGLLVTRTEDGSIAINIRGNHSFTRDDSPLYVLDGMPFEPGTGGALTGIDPYSIESIKVLKGAEAVLYGIRGQNGVIEITMKKPAKRN